MTAPADRAYARARVPHRGELLAVLALDTLVGLAVVVLLVRWVLGPSGAGAIVLGTVLVVVVLIAVSFGIAAVINSRGGAAEARELLDLGRGGDVLAVCAPDGATLHVETDGPAHAPLTVILCHDLMANLTAWRAQRAACAVTDRVVLFDQRGHGLSPKALLGGDQPGLQLLADDLAAVIDAAAPQGPIVLAGHGVGAMAIMAFARRHGQVYADRVAGVLLCGGASGPMAHTVTFGLPPALAPLNPLLRRHAAAALWLAGALPAALQRMGGMAPWIVLSRLALGHRGTPRPVAATLAAMSFDTDLQVGATFVAGLMAHDERDALLALSGKPVTVVVPGEDRFVPVADQAALRATVPGARMVRVSECGHAAPLERPDVVTEQLRALIARVRPGAPTDNLLESGLLGAPLAGLMQAPDAGTNGLLAIATDDAPNIRRLGRRPRPNETR